MSTSHNARPPIPDPSASLEEPGFAMAFWPLLVCGLGVALPFLVLLLSLKRSPSLTMEQHFIGIALACVTGSAAGAVATLVQCAVQRVHIDATRIRGYNVWGIKRVLAWEEIKRVRARRVLNVRYLLLSGERGAPLWLPLFLRDMNGFRAAVQRCAPPAHPLREALGLSSST